MNKIKGNYIIIGILLTIIFFMITASKEIIESVTFSISIWKDNLFPTLFPFFVVSSLLMSYGFIDIIGKILNKPMEKLFKLKGECGFVLAASLFSGFPSGAKYTNDLIERKIITDIEGERLLTFTHYSNPLFILGMIGMLLNNKKLALIILISHISGGLITGYIINKNKSYTKGNKLNQTKRIKEPFGTLLSKSIMDSLNTMFLLLGIITVFLIITTIINYLFHLPNLIQIMVSGLLEMTQGIKLISSENIPELLKIILITILLSFGGLSIHTQVLAIVSKTKIKYKNFLLARIIHSIIASIFVFILYSILY